MRRSRLIQLTKLPQPNIKRVSEVLVTDLEALRINWRPSGGITVARPYLPIICQASWPIAKMQAGLENAPIGLTP